MSTLEQWKEDKKRKGEWLPKEEYIAKKRKEERERIRRELAELDRLEGKKNLKSHQDIGNEVIEKEEEEEDNDFISDFLISDEGFERYYEDHITEDESMDSCKEEKKRKRKKRKRVEPESDSDGSITLCSETESEEDESDTDLDGFIVPDSDIEGKDYFPERKKVKKKKKLRKDK